MRTHWLLASVLLALVLLLTLAQRGAGAKQPPPELLALQDSMRRLGDLEDRIFDLVGSDGSTGRLVRQGSAKALQALEQEARQATMVGCADEARQALVATLEEVNRGGADGWPRAERYRDAADACEDSLTKGAPT